MLRRILSGAALLLLLAAIAYAQTTEEIIARAVEAQGGETALRAIQTIRINGHNVRELSDGRRFESDFVTMNKAPNKSYYRTAINGEPLIFASNGTMAWNQNDGALVPFALPENEARYIMADSYLYKFLLDHNKLNYSLEYEGLREFKGKQYRAVKYRHEFLNEETVHFDVETGLMSFSEQVIETSIGSAFTRRFYKEYESFGDALIATVSESHFPGEVSVNRYHKVEINIDIPDSVFELPKPDSILSEAQMTHIAGPYEHCDTGKRFALELRDGELWFVDSELGARKMWQGSDEILLFAADKQMGNIILKRQPENNVMILHIRIGRTEPVRYTRYLSSDE